MAAPTKRIGKEAYRAYLKKAIELYDTMLDAYRQERWTAAIVCAVHCAITAADAIVVSKIGGISASKDHRDAVRLLESLGAEARERAKHLGWLISVKSSAEYGVTTFTRSDAEQAVKHADRLYKWVLSQLT